MNIETILSVIEEFIDNNIQEKNKKVELSEIVQDPAEIYNLFMDTVELQGKIQAYKQTMAGRYKAGVYR